MRPDWSLHVLVDPATIPLARMPAFVAEVARGGATVLQLRGKTTPIPELVRYGEALGEEARRHGLLYLVNDRLDVALATGADGVHVGQEDLPPAAVRRVAPGLLLGLSVGSLEELARSRTGPAPDYLGVGPVFPTGSKADAGPVIGVEGLRAIAAAWPGMPVVAIGGIQPANVAAVWAAGVAGVAVISAVSTTADPEAACRALLQGRP
ncbi:MAG: thiamine phosphate synthase [Firmicutes bacterium]|nr:thiamine phosphate synthase [Bacillota bacterium]